MNVCAHTKVERQFDIERKFLRKSMEDHETVKPKTGKYQSVRQKRKKQKWCEPKPNRKLNRKTVSQIEA